MDMQKSRAAVKVEPTSEVYREETPAGIFTFHAKVAPSKPQVRRSRAAIDRDKAASPEERARAIERGRSRRLLGSLRIIYTTRDPALFRSRHRIALLTIAGNMIAIANSHVNDKLTLAALQDWADSYIAGATSKEVSQAYEHHTATNAERGVSLFLAALVDLLERQGARFSREKEVLSHLSSYPLRM